LVGELRRDLLESILEDSSDEDVTVEAPGTETVNTRNVPLKPDVDHYLGCLLGGAIGDALGYPIEFISGPEIARQYGSAPPKRLAYAGSPAVFSDDTQMTLFSAEGLIRALQRWRERGICHSPTIIQRAYHRWYRTQTTQPGPHERDGWLIREPGLFVRRGPGNTCLSALAETAGSDRVRTVDDPPNDSKGCGAVMRSAPFGMVMHARDRAFEEARDAGVLTHGHPSGYLSAAYLGSVVFDTIRGTSLVEAMRAADDLLVRERGHEEVAAVITRVRALASEGIPSMSTIEGLGGGWVGEEALGIALLCALTCEGSSPEAVAAALWRSVAHGGDSDSTGSLTGNLLGAMHGLAALPPRWLDDLELRPIVERLARDMHTAVTDEEGFLGDYPPN
jgi:ADP-ribosylglycohydrolase